MLKENMGGKNMKLHAASHGVFTLRENKMGGYAFNITN